VYQGHISQTDGSKQQQRARKLGRGTRARARACCRRRRPRKRGDETTGRTAKLAVGVILDLVDLQRRLLGVRHLCGRHGDDVGLGARRAKRARARLGEGEGEEEKLSLLLLRPAAVPCSKDVRGCRGGEGVDGKLWLSSVWRARIFGLAPKGGGVRW
jgi:hypothetical protein